MTATIATVTSSDSVDHCMELMTDKRVRHLPVVEQGELVGLVSIGDVVFSCMSDQEEMIRQLESYVDGKF